MSELIAFSVVGGAVFKWSNKKRIIRNSWIWEQFFGWMHYKMKCMYLIIYPE